MLKTVLNIEKLFNIDHIRMIFWCSFYTEDWSNDAENSALPSQE